MEHLVEQANKIEGRLWWVQEYLDGDHLDGPDLKAAKNELEMVIREAFMLRSHLKTLLKAEEV